MSDMSLKSNPFILWNSYDSTNSKNFFGRDAEIVRLINTLKENHFTIIYGKSGIGKSSILKAGIICNDLVEKDIADNIIYFEDYSIGYFNQILKNDCGIEEYSNTPIDILFNYIHSPRKPTLLIFDQFEKIFYDWIIDQHKLKDTYKILLMISNLIREQKPNLYIIISIKEENVSNLYEASVENNLGLLSDKWGIKIYNITRERIAEIIKSNFGSVNIDISDSTLEIIINTLETMNDKNVVHLPDLQVICYELFNIEAETSVISDNKITRELLLNIIDRFYANTYNNLSIAEQEILKKGVSSTGERTKILSEALFHITDIYDESEEIKKAVFDLIEKKLIKPVGQDFEIVHEYLAKKIKENLSFSDIRTITVKEMIQRAVLDNLYNNDILIDLPRLEEINRYRDKLIDLDYNSVSLILKSSLRFDFLQENRNYWFVRLESFPEKAVDFYNYIISLHDDDISHKFHYYLNDKLFVIERLRVVHLKGDIQNDDYFNLIKITLRSKNFKEILKVVETLENIDDIILEDIINIIQEYDDFNLLSELYSVLSNKKNQYKLKSELKKWMVSDNLMLTYKAIDYFSHRKEEDIIQYFLEKIKVKEFGITKRLKILQALHKLEYNINDDEVLDRLFVFDIISHFFYEHQLFINFYNKIYQDEGIYNTIKLSILDYVLNLEDNIFEPYVIFFKNQNLIDNLVDFSKKYYSIEEVSTDLANGFFVDGIAYYSFTNFDLKEVYDYDLFTRIDTSIETKDISIVVLDFKNIRFINSDSIYVFFRVIKNIAHQNFKIFVINLSSHYKDKFIIINKLVKNEVIKIYF